MGKKRVPLHQNPRGFVDVDPDATPGAQVGVNLLGPDGRVLTAAQVINPVDSGSSGGPSGISATVWKLIREIPLNIQKLAALVGKGIAIRRNDGEWALRTLQQGAEVAITNGDGEAGNPTIGLTTGALASLALADTALQQVQPGSNISVDNTDPKRPIVSADVSGSGLYPILTDQLGNPLTDQLGRQLYSNVPALNILTPMTLAAANALTGVADFQMVAITDLAGGREPCWYDSTVASGTKWRRFSDRSIAN